MKKLPTKNFLALFSASCLIVFFLQSCQKEIPIKEMVNEKTGLANTLAKSNIIYHDVVPDVTLASNGYSGHNTYNLDLNSDGVTDFSIDAYLSRYYYNTSKDVSIIVSNENGVASNTYPLEMNLNDTIASNLHWIVGGTSSLRHSHYPPSGGVWSGNWSDATDHYLGLKIKSEGNSYYGWMRLDVSVSTSSYPLFTVKDYAYNSSPNQLILAGQTK